MMSIGAGANTELGVSDMRTKVLVKHKADIHWDDPEVGAYPDEEKLKFILRDDPDLFPFDLPRRPRIMVEVRAFELFLIAEGWRLVREPSSWADVIAIRGAERPVAEADVTRVR